MVLTSSELCCLASCCLKSSHPFSIMILAGSQSPPMPGSDYTFFFSIHNRQYVRLRRRGAINLLCVWCWRVVTLTDPDHAAPDHGVLSLWARSEAQVFVLSCRRTRCRICHTKWKKKVTRQTFRVVVGKCPILLMLQEVKMRVLSRTVNACLGHLSVGSKSG